MRTFFFVSARERWMIVYGQQKYIVFISTNKKCMAQLIV